MGNLRSILAASALVMAVVLPVAAWAQDGQQDERGVTLSSQTIHEVGEAHWLYALGNAQCRAIPSKYGVINPDSNDRVAQITTKTKPNGSRQIDVFDVVTGTAVGNDNAGSRYVWVYENHAIYSLPESAGPVKASVRVVDRFRLIGNGLNFETSFDWRWRFPVAEASTFDPGVEFNGVAFPDDAAHPTNVLNFKAYDTLNDPLSCDPL